MVKKRTIRRSSTQERPTDDDETIIEEIEETEEPEEDKPPELEALKQEFVGSDFRVVVYKLSDNNTSWDRVSSYSLDQFNADLVAAEYGGGKFRFKIVNAQGKFIKHMSQSYAKPAAKAVEAKRPEDNGLQMVSFIQKEMQSRESMMLQFMNTMKEVVIGRQQQPVDMLDTIMKVKSLLGEPKDVKTEFEKVFEMFRLGMELGKGVGESEADQSPTDTIIKKLADVFLPTLANLGKMPPEQLAAMMNQKVPAAAQTAQPPAVVPGEAAPKPRKIVVYENSSERTIMQLLEQSKDTLVAYAKLNADTHNVAESIIDALDELADNDMFELANYLSVKSDRIYEFFVDLKPYKEWVDRVVKDILAIVNEIKQGIENKNMEVIDGSVKEVKENAEPESKGNDNINKHD